jgi:hypothetical protein
MSEFAGGGGLASSCVSQASHGSHVGCDLVCLGNSDFRQTPTEPSSSRNIFENIHEHVYIKIYYKHILEMYRKSHILGISFHHVGFHVFICIYMTCFNIYIYREREIERD